MGNLQLKHKANSLYLKNILLLCVLGFFLFFYGNNLVSLFDNSETNYSAVAQEVINTHDYLTMHYNGRDWYVHPPLYFWLSSSLCEVFGWNEFNLRFFEALFGLFGILITYLIAKKFFSNRTAFYSAIILGTSIYYNIISRLAIFDTLLNFFILLSIYLFLSAYYNRKRKFIYFFLFAISTSLAVLSKGPIGLVHPGIVIIPFLLIKKDLKFLFDYKVLINFILFLFITAPWYAHQLVLHGKEFFDFALRDYTWFRFFGTVEGQTGPIYYYIFILLLFLPWIFYIPLIIHKFIKKETFVGNLKQNEFVLFSLLFIIITFLFFSVAKTKLPNYIFSIFPFISILLASALRSKNNKSLTLLCSSALIIFQGILVLNSFTMEIAYPYNSERILLQILFILMFALYLLLSFFLVQKKTRTAITSIAFGTIFFLMFLFHVFFPSLEKFKESKVFVEILKQVTTSYTLINCGGYSPYLIYYLNHHVIHVNSLDKIPQVNETETTYIILSNSEFDSAISLITDYEIIKKSYTKTLIKVNKKD
ncbi:MAG: hypothetical protein A2Y40_04405 [Candidatus Margulisbacteria bacterium GWF2_35_9]|nr:MAG: hypothetical protein A2Y40_04405 [Candidatus Margulisbacteria bacterium GWF2_35_9]